MPDSREWIPVAQDFERVATHEAGHAVTGLALGVALEFIELLTPQERSPGPSEPGFS